MPNILTADDARFVSSVGHWESFDPSLGHLTRETTPTSPGGHNVGRLEHFADSTTIAVSGRIPRGIYPIANGDLLQLDLDFMVPDTNTGTGQLFCQALINIYPSNPASAGATEAFATSDPFDPGDGWLHLTVPQFTVFGPGAPAAWVGLQVNFSRWDIADGVGILVGDVAYFSDLNLNLGPIEVGGWGVGMVRMGPN